ncbi:MAG TPA: DUF1127 domain-containing protein [Paracoccaceae bacterium]|nr:DUF1127 domain-containing protein [Paracoccaceae bacterium]
MPASSSHSHLAESLAARARLPALADIALRLAVMFATWSDRAKSRRDLAEMDDTRLQDIGISRLEAYREAAKPFWRR